MYAAATRRSSSYTTGATSSAFGGRCFDIRGAPPYSCGRLRRFFPRIVDEVVRTQHLFGARSCLGVPSLPHLLREDVAVAVEDAVKNRCAVCIRLFDDREQHPRP